MTAHDPMNIESAVGDQDFYERFIALRVKLKKLGAEIVSVHHANHRVDVEWLPRGAGSHDEPSRSTLFRLSPGRDPGGADNFMFARGNANAALGLVA